MITIRVPGHGLWMDGFLSRWRMAFLDRILSTRFAVPVPSTPGLVKPSF